MIDLVNWQQEEPNGCGGGRQPSVDGTSRISREAYVRFCERLRVQFPGPTRRRYCNGSPILEACASDEIHSAVSHNPNALDGCFRLLVRKKHLQWAHVRVISTLRYPSAQLPRLNY